MTVSRSSGCATSLSASGIPGLPRTAAREVRAGVAPHDTAPVGSGYTAREPDPTTIAGEGNERHHIGSMCGIPPRVVTRRPLAREIGDMS